MYKKGSKNLLFATLLALLIGCEQNPPSPSELYQKYRSSVVLIKNEYYFEINFNNELQRYYTINASGEPNFYENEFDAAKNASLIFGTGFFISQDGKIATNRHVIYPESQEEILSDSFHNFYLELKNEIADYISDCEGILSSLDSIRRFYTLTNEQTQRLNDTIISTQNEIISSQNYLSSLSRFDKKNIFVEMKSVSLSIAFDNTFVTNANDFNECVPISIPVDSEIDLAVIQLKDKQLPARVSNIVNLTYLKPEGIKLNVNDEVYMIGYNYGLTIASTQEGIKNQFNSGRISQEGDNNKILYSIPTLQGSSGSPVIDKWGNLVVFNYAKIKETQSFSYGIPVKKLIDLYSGNLASQSKPVKPLPASDTDHPSPNPSDESIPNKPTRHIVFNDFSDIIRQFLQSEDEREFSKIYSFYADTIRRYWTINNPSYQDLKNQYELAWKATSSSKNTIQQINKVADEIYEVKLIFDYYHTRKQKQMSVQSTIRIYFNENGKVVEVYGI